MNSTNRPFAVTCVAWLYIAVGGVMFAYHFPELLHLQKDAFVVELTEFLGLTAGVFMLRGHNWARWLALAWGAFHIALTAIPPFHGLIVHLLVFGGIAVILLRSDANQYFRSQPN
jgi:hypothetical protein